MKKIRKAILPLCGFETDCSPATKAIPVEMLPVQNRPMIQHVVDEARDAGIEEFIFVTGRNRSVIENHFDFNHELSDTRKKRGESHVDEAFQADLLAPGKAIFIHQHTQSGIGNAILCARDLIGDEPFAVLSPTRLIKSEMACIKQLMKVKREPGDAVLAVEEVAAHHVSNRTIVARSTRNDSQFRVTDLISQPTPDKAPSNLAVVGRYIFPPTIFQILQNLKINAGSNIQLTDAIRKLVGSKSVVAQKIEGISFDCDSQPGVVIANMIYALDHESISQELVEEVIRTGLRSRINGLLDANALAELASTLQIIGKTA